MPDELASLFGKISGGTARIGILGMGYVGLPLAMTFSKKFMVVGYDVEIAKISNLIKGKSFIDDIKDSEIKETVHKSFYPTNMEADLKPCDFFIICVPTPLSANHKPDLSYIIKASQLLSHTIKKGSFVILESTTYPGTTEEIVCPILEESGLKAGTDFGLAFSPERVDPGNQKWKIDNTPKLVGGLNKLCTEIAEKLYSSVISARIIKVSDPKTAEAAKLVENIFRATNIALVNELALIFEKMGIDTWEVIDAAATKPFSFMPHYPGPGVGGHCIPLDPFYMSYRAEQFGIIPRFIQQAGIINEHMRVHAVSLLTKGLKKRHKRIYGAKVLVLGAAYKKNISDTRESPAIDIIEELLSLGAIVRYHDPHVKKLRLKHTIVESEPLGSDFIKSADAAIIATAHDAFKDISKIGLNDKAFLVDCFNLLRDSKAPYDIIFLGKSTNGHK